MVVTSAGEFQTAAGLPACPYMLASPAISPAARGPTVKKGIVALLLLLAIVVLVSPGIIGRLAEKSVDNSLSWADDESSEVTITATGYSRGWFTSAGQHRVELLHGELYYLLLAAFAPADHDHLPVLLLDTRLDHGLIPVTSMTREHGSLLPGLGNAVSTLSVELADGSVVALPGTIYSSIGLGGEVVSNFILEAGGHDADSGRIDWGGSDFLVTSRPGDGGFAISGALDSLAIESPLETMIIGKLTVDLDQRRSAHGYMIGPASVALESFAVVSENETMAAGPLRLRSGSAIDGGRLRADLAVSLENTPLPMFGSGSLEMIARLENVDAGLLGALKRNVDALRKAGAGDASLIDIQGDVQRLLAAGLELHFDRLDVALPMGQITSRISAKMSRSGEDDYSWASALMALDASADISLPVELVDMMSAGNPEMQSAIAMGFLRRKGDSYTMQAAFKQGLLTINGAPMPVPLPEMQ